MIMYILRLIASCFFTVLCLLTNWLVLLFADEDGELHGFWNYYQTWDNSCNPSDVVDILPAWLTTWYSGHYWEYYRSEGELAEMGRGRWFTPCVRKDFTLWQRFTRYICRVYWLTRNSAYGFCFYLLGVDFNPSHALNVWTDGQETHVQDLEDKDVWCYSNSKRIFWKIHWNIYLGYKLVLDAEKITHCMIANRITFKIVV